ncbi:MAG: lipoprotein [Pseudomonadota bacterium]
MRTFWDGAGRPVIRTGALVSLLALAACGIKGDPLPVEDVTQAEPSITATTDEADDVPDGESMG